MPKLFLMFYTSGAVNPVYGMLLIGLFICTVWQFFRRKNLYFTAVYSVSFWLLLLFGICYVMIGSADVQGIVYYLVCPLLAFTAGWIMVESGKYPPEKTIKYTLYFMLAGYAVHAFLNWKINIGTVRWLLIDFFTRDLRAATGSGAINTMIFSLLAYFVLLEKNKIIRMLGLAAGVIGLSYAFLLGSRTQFVILLLVCVSFLFLYLNEKYGKSAVLRLALILVVLGGAGWVAYQTNLFNLQTYIDNSNLMARYNDVYGLEDSDGYRFSSISRGLGLMLAHPFGGLINTVYYHNFWLDIGRVGGIIPFLAMAVYSFIINWHLFLIMRSKKEEDWFRYLLFCIYLGVQINFATEPVLEGLLDFFLCFTIINGMVECYYYRKFLPLQRQNKNIRKEENYAAR